MASERIRCFLICPIGSKGSEIRSRSDKVLKFIISPVAKKLGFDVVRADKIPLPGIITDQIIKHLLDDELVIADLTDSNPNVFYELAIRHAARKPVVHIIQENERIPFDTAAMRTVEYSFDVGRIAHVKKELENQVSFALREPSQITTPFSISTDMRLNKDVKQIKRIEDLGKKVILFLNRDSMIEYFVEMYSKAMRGDVLWAQGVGHTAYPKNLKEHLLRMANRGVEFEVIINAHSTTADQFKDLLRSISTARFVERTDNVTRVQGLSDKEVLIGLPTTESYAAVVIRDTPLVTILRNWFNNRFKR